MIDSKLILIEGVPCSGKSTIAEKLAKDISYNGIKCECYLEWSKDSPVFIGNVEDLSEIISTIGSRKKRILKDWINFTKNTKQLETVDIIESHFWQTEAMYLYLSGHFEYEIFKRNKKVVSVISELNPILIYLAP
ncbi:MAG: hypothetical protein JW997_06665 [Actinobacteria bacterium]|nr:hypothetical protein [Actinomycetota bacterium]